MRLLNAVAKLVLTGDELVSYLVFVKVMMNYFKKVVKYHGLAHAVAIAKAMGLHVTRYLSGNPLFVSSVRISINKDGLPRIFGAAILSLIKGRNRNLVRMVLSLLSWHRLAKGNGKLNTSSITGHGLGDQFVCDSIVKWYRTLSPGLLNSIGGSAWKAPHLSTKAGPNGVALGTCMQDLHVIPDSLSQAIRSLGGYNLSFYMDDLLKFPVDLLPTGPVPDDGKVRRFSVIRDKSMKNRVIAIFDYWSQTALSPLHEAVMEMLSRIPNDCTFEQGKEISLAKGKSEFFCFDLSSATDRFPMLLQHRILALLIGENRAAAWKAVMVDYEFSHPSLPQGVKYETGQPMGAYSSWPIFTLCHHVVVQYSAASVGYEGWFEDYALLGDDLVIYDSKVAHMYRAVMEALGVEISQSKSHTSTTFREFAKRFFLSGEEISPLPLHDILESWNYPDGLSRTLIDLLDRGWFGDNSPSVVPSQIVCSIIAAFTKDARSIDRLSQQTLESILSVSLTQDDPVWEVDAINADLVNVYPKTSIGLPCGSEQPLQNAVNASIKEYLKEKLHDASLQSQKVIDQWRERLSRIESKLAMKVVSSDDFIPINIMDALPWIEVSITQNVVLNNAWHELNAIPVGDVNVEDFVKVLAKTRLLEPTTLDTTRVFDRAQKVRSRLNTVRLDVLKRH